MPHLCCGCTFYIDLCLPIIINKRGVSGSVVEIFSFLGSYLTLGRVTVLKVTAHSCGRLLDQDCSREVDGLSPFPPAKSEAHMGQSNCMRNTMELLSLCIFTGVFKVRAALAAGWECVCRPSTCNYSAESTDTIGQRKQRHPHFDLRTPRSSHSASAEGLFFRNVFAQQ